MLSYLESSKFISSTSEKMYKFALSNLKHNSQCSKEFHYTIFEPKKTLSKTIFCDWKNVMRKMTLSSGKMGDIWVTVKYMPRSPENCVSVFHSTCTKVPKCINFHRNCEVV